MSTKSNQPPPQRTQTEEHAPKPSLHPNIDHVPHGLVTAAVRRYNDLGNATSSLPSSRPSPSEDFDKREDKDEDVFQLDQLSLVHSRSRSSIENMDQVTVADAVETDPKDTDDLAHREEAPITIITEDSRRFHQQIPSQMMSKTIEDLPNEMINKIFNYLDESDVILTGLAYNRLSRHNVVGDELGRKYCIFMPAVQH